MTKIKIATIVGTRPEIIRLSRVISLLDRYMEQTLIHTGQNYDYELNQIFFEDLELRLPDIYLDAAGENGVETIGNVIIKIDRVLNNIEPDAILILGDTNSCMSAISAKRRKIPIFHMEAGNRCFDMRVPEEINRKIVDHTADVNLTYSTIARDYLISEGLRPDLVIKTGSPMKEVLTYYSEKISSSNVLSELILNKGEFFLVSIHREENIEPEGNIKKIYSLLEMLSLKFGIPIIVSTHPRTRKAMEALGIKSNEQIRLLKPLCFSDYNHLQLNARVVLSDSGTINEESSILNFKALNIRESHERPEGMEEGVAMMVGLNSSRVLQGIAILDAQSRGSSRTIQLVNDYDVTNVSEKVVRVVTSYIDYVNRVIWHKS
ncbi:MAG TPA: UDP-N-acetylglucosamine 2-epimerase (non-hydrolyzing) [Opitutae bacterium]|nr:UDP-N-acetylglucosamine 2-epimerase (non-hydrolyzing) [Opitutae bacterium]